MKNVLSYYYNLHLNNIHQINGTYFFTINNIDYAFFACNIELNQIEKAYKLSLELLSKGIPSHQFIYNKNDQLITYVNQKPYILFKLNGNINKKIDINDIINFSFLSPVIDDNNIINWAELWSQKMDYFEYQVNQFGKKYPLIRKSFSYFLGIVENGISLFNSLNFKEQTLTISHRRISNNYFDFYNPLNFVIDYKVRDVSEYFKQSFVDNHNILNDIKKYLSNKNLNVNDILLFYTRMFYPSFYFDQYEHIINNEENDDELKNIIELTPKYEQLLKDLYKFLSSYIVMPDIEWIKKT